MYSQIIPLITPILSLGILTLGNGFYTTLTTLQLSDLNFSNLTIGLISAFYFAGMMLGAFFSQSIVLKTGHIRSFSFCAALMSISCMIQGMYETAVIWGIARFIAGFALSGLFVVIGSWCISGVEKKYKGLSLGLYLFVFYLAQSAGQLLLKFNYSSKMMPFCIISILACCSIIPVSLTKFNAPQPQTPEMESPFKYIKFIPLGSFSAFISGMLIGVIYSLFPLALDVMKMSNSQIAYIMSATIFGGMIFQIPIGKLSDAIDRRLVLLGISIFSLIFTFLAMFFSYNAAAILIFSFFIGGFVFSIYPISISQSCDNLDESKTVVIISIITLVNGIGLMLGPVIGSFFLNLVNGINGLFLFIIISNILLTILILYIIYKRNPVNISDKVSYTIAPPRVTIGISDVIEEKLNR